jgi:cytochrome c oxidase assembly protein subunit 15
MSITLVLALAAVVIVALAVIVAAAGWARMSSARFLRLARWTAILTFILVVVGAWVRLSDAGLGCPDWPGCYGQPHVPQALPADHQHVEPAGGFDAAKGWKEMGHRYLASFVGMLIAALALASLRGRAVLGRSPLLPLALVAIVILQAALGRWTVTLLLKPAIVTLHLLGGLTTLALLVWMTLRAQADAGGRPATGFRSEGLVRAAGIGLALLVCQIVLGGWVSTNYAALACPELPTCRGGEWVPPMAFAQAFEVIRELGRTGDGQFLSLEALTAIHWMHRLGALVVFVYGLWLGVRLLREPPLRTLAGCLLGLLMLQVAAGIGNVLLSLPIHLAVAHNAGAAALLVTLVVINFRLRQAVPRAA